MFTTTVTEMDAPEEVRTEEIAFSRISEDFNLYQLNDGNILKMKLVVLRVIKYPDKIDDLGMPNYTIKSQNVLYVIPPEGLQED